MSVQDRSGFGGILACQFDVMYEYDLENPLLVRVAMLKYVNRALFSSMM
jgi:hypothetical protein